MNKLFLILILFLFVGCEPPSAADTNIIDSELPIPEFNSGEKVVLINRNPAIVTQKSLSFLDGKHVYRYQVNFFNTEMEMRSGWFYEFELGKSQ